MKKISKATLTVCAGALIAFGAPSSAGAEQKKDVSDPVLNEVIQTLGPRMPRFVDKHGKDVFVTDAPVTRGSLMLALYEYDKSLKIPKRDAVSKQEFDELNARLAALENGGVDKKHRRQEDMEKNPLDITEIINDLMPNMPVLLDGSLNNSKVFTGLRDEVMSCRQQGGDEASSEGLTQTKYELRELAKRVDMMERSASRDAAPAPDQASLSLKKDLSATRSQLARLEKRVNQIERNGETQQVAARVSSGSDDVKAYTSTLAKISMGLSMVAALFIAR